MHLNQVFVYLLLGIVSGAASAPVSSNMIASSELTKGITQSANVASHSVMEARNISEGWEEVSSDEDDEKWEKIHHPGQATGQPTKSTTVVRPEPPATIGAKVPAQKPKGPEPKTPPVSLLSYTWVGIGSADLHYQRVSPNDMLIRRQAVELVEKAAEFKWKLTNYFINRDDPYMYPAVADPDTMHTTEFKFLLKLEYDVLKGQDYCGGRVKGELKDGCIGIIRWGRDESGKGLNSPFSIPESVTILKYKLRHVGGVMKQQQQPQQQQPRTSISSTALSSRDIFARAKNGMGKTAAFIIPLLSKINVSRPYIQGIVLVPTRELALQIASVTKMLSKHMGGRSHGHHWRNDPERRYSAITTACVLDLAGKGCVRQQRTELRSRHHRFPSTLKDANNFLGSCIIVSSPSPPRISTTTKSSTWAVNVVRVVNFDFPKTQRRIYIGSVVPDVLDTLGLAINLVTYEDPLQPRPHRTRARHGDRACIPREVDRGLYVSLSSTEEEQAIQVQREKEPPLMQIVSACTV
ncbi:hypothetical protein F5051DRAFT_424662 [Lentinula edodes]|nr:hypothetical protein F5051DRAFT_424662 [Lentinula edodes]